MDYPIKPDSSASVDYGSLVRHAQIAKMFAEKPQSIRVRKQRVPVYSVEYFNLFVVNIVHRTNEGQLAALDSFCGPLFFQKYLI